MFKKIFFHWNELGLLQMEILMKKKPIILVLILWSFINVSSEEIFKDVLPGQYIFYQDKRGANNRITGLLKYYDGSIICRTYDLNNQSETLVQLDFSSINKENDIKAVNTFHGDLMNDYQFVMVDLMNIWSQYETVKDGLNFKEVNKQDDWPEFKYTLEHKFVKWIPFLKFYSTRKTDVTDPTYKLILIGKMQDPKDPVFMNFKSIPASKPFPSFKLIGNKINTIKMEGASIQLDENWKFMEPSPEYNTYHDTYWIKIKSQRDAQIGVETISFLDKYITKDIEHSPYQLASLIISASLMVEPTSVHFQDLPDGSLKVSFVVLSPNELFATQCIYFIHKSDSNDYKIINFSTFKSLYDENIKYFNEVLDTIKIK